MSPETTPTTGAPGPGERRPDDGAEPTHRDRRSSRDRPPSRALPRPRRTWGQRLLLTTGVVLSVVAVLAATVVAYGAWKLRSIDRTDVQLDSPVASGEPRNYLLVGSDTRSAGDPNDPGARDDHKPLADTIMVLRVDPDEQQAMILSLPRDLWVTIAGTDDEGRINAAYAAGHQQLIDTLRSELGIPIHHYVEVDFKGFQEVVSAIDGVPMWFDRAMRDRNSGLDVLHPGCTVLDGYGALAFARARHLEYYENGGFEYDGTGDLGRISRQQLFLRRVISRAKSKGLHNPLTLKRLVDVGASNVTIDDSLATTELLSLARRFADFDPDELLTYTLPTSPRTTSGGAKVEDLDVADAQPLLDLFRDHPTSASTSSTGSVGGSPSSTSDGGSTSTAGSDGAALDPSDPDDLDRSVSVLNSAGEQGLAVEVADDLVARGFEVDHWGNGDERGHPSEARTVVRYAPGDEAAGRTVAAWISGGADVVADDQVASGTVELYLGADFTAVGTSADPSVVGAGPGQSEDGSGSETTTAGDGATSTTAATPATVPPSSDVVGMVPLGDPPPDRECG